VKRVFRAASLLQVAHARNVLIAAGIDSELRNQYLAGALGDLPMLETWPQLWVEDDFESAALRALEKASSAPSGAGWICSQCGEQLEPQFTTCWRCGAAVSA
jgi:Putative prokaryotic signal transducing protein